MSMLVDWQIRGLCIDSWKWKSRGEVVPLSDPLLSPFSEGKQGGGIISLGLTSAGYDLRLGYKVLMFKNTFAESVDPKDVKKNTDRVFDTIDGLKQGERVFIPPGGYILGYSLEYIRMPRNLKGTCLGKSTLARCGVHINTTPVEPMWHGFLTLEIANHAPCPVCVYAGEGIAQIEFHVLDQLPELDYEAKQGKYQAQGAEPVPARV